MLQRVKWQRKEKTIETETNNQDEDDQNNDNINSNIPGVQYWSRSSQASTFYDWIHGNKLPLPSSGDDDYNDDGVVLHMGALCESSNSVTIVARHYSNNKDDNKELHSVLFLQGYQRS